jgi:hypothetical protein
MARRAELSRAAPSRARAFAPIPFVLALACARPAGDSCPAVPGECSSARVESPADAATCVTDECSLSTLRAMLTAELRASTAGEQHAESPAVRAAAAAIARDMREAEQNLSALERQMSVAEVPCAESRRVAADLDATLDGDAPSSDRSFVRAQVDALERMKHAINDDLMGCAANGNLKMTLRFVRRRRSEDGGADRGIVPGLIALQTWLAEASP